MCSVAEITESGTIFRVEGLSTSHFLERFILKSFSLCYYSKEIDVRLSNEVGDFAGHATVSDENSHSGAKLEYSDREDFDRYVSRWSNTQYHALIGHMEYDFPVYWSH